MNFRIRWNTSGLLNYVHTGQVTLRRLKDAMRKVANGGRTTSRRLISSQFVRRTGRLAKDARAIRAQAIAKQSQVSAKVGPMPSLLNIFEKGATIPSMTIKAKRAKAMALSGGGWDGIFVKGEVIAGGGRLDPRPVMAPSLNVMEKTAVHEIRGVLNQAVKK